MKKQPTLVISETNHAWLEIAANHTTQDDSTTKSTITILAVILNSGGQRIDDTLEDIIKRWCTDHPTEQPTHMPPPARVLDVAQALGMWGTTGTTTTQSNNTTAALPHSKRSGARRRRRGRARQPQPPQENPQPTPPQPNQTVTAKRRRKHRTPRVTGGSANTSRTSNDSASGTEGADHNKRSRLEISKVTVDLISSDSSESATATEEPTQKAVHKPPVPVCSPPSTANTPIPSPQPTANRQPQTSHDTTQLASDEWAQPIVIGTVTRTRTRLTGPQWQFDTEVEVPLDSEESDEPTPPRRNQNAIPSGPWTPFEWKDGTDWTTREIPMDKGTPPPNANFLKERLQRWLTLKDTGHVSRMGVEEMATLARLFGVSITVTHIQYHQPPVEDKVLTKLYELAVTFPYIPSSVRRQVWNEVTASNIPREKSWSLIDTIKLEVMRRLQAWPDRQPQSTAAHTTDAVNWRKDTPILSYIGGVHRVQVVMLRAPWDRDMEWCPAWIEQDELVYSRGPWQDMKVWQACLMAMGIGYHGAIKWYERNTLIHDNLTPKLKKEYGGYDVSVQKLNAETRRIIKQVLEAVKRQPHALGWEHRVRWLRKDLDPLGKQYWSAEMCDRWNKWKSSGNRNEIDEHMFITSAWYTAGRLAIWPPVQLIEEGHVPHH